MTYEVLLETRARREFLELPVKEQARIGEVIDDLARDARPPGAKKLVGVGGYRVRQGDYRILFTVDDRRREVRVYRIAHRREAYR